MLETHPVRNIKLAMQLAADGRPKYLIAALSGMPSNTLAGIVSGRVVPAAQQLERLAAVLGCNATDIDGVEASS